MQVLQYIDTNLRVRNLFFTRQFVSAYGLTQIVYMKKSAERKIFYGEQKEEQRIFWNIGFIGNIAACSLMVWKWIKSAGGGNFHL